MLIEEVEDILDEFDFHRVQDTMKALNWKYHDTVDAYPSIGELRRLARKLLQNAFEAPPCSEWITGCGGFEVHRNMYPGDTKKYLSLQFNVTEGNNYD